MLTVHGRATSLNVQAVMWLLAELDLPVERLDLGFPFGGTDTPEYRAMNPNGLVPTMQDEHVTLFESAAILRYLAARRDEAALTAALARFDRDLATLEAQVGDGPWVLGEDFTVADILVGHQLYRYFTIDVPRTDRPGIAAYYARLRARPAFAEHVMVSYDSLRDPDA